MEPLNITRELIITAARQYTERSAQANELASKLSEVNNDLARLTPLIQLAVSNETLTDLPEDVQTVVDLVSMASVVEAIKSSDPLAPSKTTEELIDAIIDRVAYRITDDNCTLSDEQRDFLNTLRLRTEKVIVPVEVDVPSSKWDEIGAKDYNPLPGNYSDSLDT